MSSLFFDLRPLRLVLGIVAICGIAGCTSKPMPNRSAESQLPLADQKPTSREEEAYYRDVYSGEWKKRQVDPLGALGIAKNSASTNPPPHWSMSLPDGAKTMEQVYTENYQRQVAAGGNPNLPPGAVPVALNPNATTNPYPLAPNSPNTPNSTPNNGSYAPYNPTPNRPSSATESDLNKTGPPGAIPPWSASPWSGGIPWKMFSATSLIRAQQADSPDISPAISGGIRRTEPLKIDPALVNRVGPLDRELLPQSAFGEYRPSNESIVDGGDAGGKAAALPNWEVRNVEPEDTVAHFDTLDGRILVEPSNRVEIYSPRFGSIRQILGPRSQSQNVMLIGAATQIGVSSRESTAGIDIRSQDERTRLTRGTVHPGGTGANQPGASLANEEGAMENVGLALPVGLGVLLASWDMTAEHSAALIDGAASATAWGEVQPVSVEIDTIAAQGNITLAAPSVLFLVENKNGTESKLRLTKVASKNAAPSGALIEFAIRFENIGAEPIGNVTILDSLSARLEYVADSAASSKAGNFLVNTNEVGSLLLRWEITDPLEPNDSGVVTFLARVR